jgi:hypothetical protein
MAHWSQRLILSAHTGWYTCNATSTGAVVGTDLGYTYIDVTAQGQTPPADLQSLTYPNLPVSARDVNNDDNSSYSLPMASSSSTVATESLLSTNPTSGLVHAEKTEVVTSVNYLTSAASTGGVVLELTSTVLSLSNWTVVFPTPSTAVSDNSITLPIAKPSTGWQTSEIIGLSVGLGLGFLVLVILIVGVLCFVRHREKRRKKKPRHSILGDVPASPVFSAYIRSSTRTGPSSFKPGISLASGNSPGTDIDPGVPHFTFPGAVDERSAVDGRTPADSSRLVRLPVDSESSDCRTEGPGEREELLSFRPTATTHNGNKTPAV